MSIVIDPTAGSITGVTQPMGVGAATAATHAVPLAQTIGKNLIINGNMSIYQRGTAAVTTYAYGPADRWISGAAGNTFSTTQGSFVSGDILFDTGGAQYFTQIAITSVAGAANYLQYIQRIEDVRKTAGQTVTVSFWAKVASGTPSIGIEVGQNFGTGGSATVTGVGQSQALTTTWTKYSKTFSVPSINGKTIGTEATHSTTLSFWLDSGSDFNTRSGSIGQSSKTVSIAQVQLEISPVATAFEHRPYGYELALCQRYYQKSFPIETAPVQNSGISSVVWTQILTGYGYFYHARFIVPMRVAPTITGYNPNAANAFPQGPTTNLTTTTSGNISTSGFSQNSYGGADDTTGTPIRWNWTATSEL